MDSRSPDLNANIGSPTGSNSQKDFDLNKNYNFDKGYKDVTYDAESPVSEKFKNSPLLVDKKLSNSGHESPKQSPFSEKKILNSPHSSCSREEKIINSPSLSLNDNEEKILNSPRLSQASRGEEFVILNPARSSVTSQMSDSSAILSPSLQSPTFDDNEVPVSEKEINLPHSPQPTFDDGEQGGEEKIINNPLPLEEKVSNLPSYSQSPFLQVELPLDSEDPAEEVDLPQQDEIDDTINDEITELENQNNVDSPVFSTTSSASPRPSSCERYMSDETLMDVLDMNNLQDSFG